MLRIKVFCPFPSVSLPLLNYCTNNNKICVYIPLYTFVRRGFLFYSFVTYCYDFPKAHLSGHLSFDGIYFFPLCFCRAHRKLSQSHKHLLTQNPRGYNQHIRCGILSIKSLGDDNLSQYNSNRIRANPPNIVCLNGRIA